MGHNNTYHPTVKTAFYGGWKVSADCRCGHAGPISLMKLADNLKLADLERRLRCTHCGSRRCRLVVHEPPLRETEGERAAKARAARNTS